MNKARGETALWIAVITQAMMDALSRANNTEAKYQKTEALRWLTENSKDFTQVCSYAGLDPDWVRRKVKKALVNPASWRAAPGKGKRYVERKAYRMRLKKEKIASHKKSAGNEGDSNVIAGPWANVKQQVA